MSLLGKLKSLFGGSEDSDRDTAVTVEREPEATNGDDADHDQEPEREGTGPDADDAPSEDDGESTDDDGTPVQDIKGVGPTYADRLGEAGIDTVADLAAADVADLAEETGISEGRLANWIEQAEARIHTE